MGDFRATQEADQLAHHRPEGGRLRLPGHSGGWQRRARRLRGVPRGGGPGARGRRPHAHRVRHLSPGHAHHGGRSDQVPDGGGSEGVGAEGTAHALPRLPRGQAALRRVRRGAGGRGDRARGGTLRGHARSRSSRHVRPRLRRAARAPGRPARRARRAPAGIRAGRSCRRHGAGLAAHARPAHDHAIGRADSGRRTGLRVRAMAKLNMVKALNLALLEEMERDPDIVIIGEDVGVDGGVFRVTEGLHRRFGGRRVIDSPLAEAGIIGASVGMALYGLKPVSEIQFSGFAFQCFHQIENHAARYRQRSQGRFHCSMVMRMPYGGGVRALEHHSESEEQFYAHIPGLKMVVPSGPRTARALLTAAIRDPDPVVFFEAKALYHAMKEDVPDEPEVLAIGRARVARAGDAVTLVSYGAMLRVALDAADILAAEDGVEAEVIDLLTISPLDREAIVESVARTGRAVVVHEAARSFGPGAEIAASIMEGAFLRLEAPVRRVTAHDVPFPGFAREKGNVPAAARETLAY